MIQECRQSEPSKISKYKNDTYYKGSFCGGINIDLKIIACEDNIYILSKLQFHLLCWYQSYLLQPGIDRTEAIIFQHFFWPDIRDSVWKEVNNCDTYQRTKRLNIKYVKLPSKLDEEIPWNKLCVGLIGPYIIRREWNKEKLHLKSVTMIYSVTGWFEVT